MRASCAPGIGAAGGGGSASGRCEHGSVCYRAGGLAGLVDGWDRVGEVRRTETAGRFAVVLSAVERQLAQDRAASIAAAYRAVHGELAGDEIPSLRTVHQRLRDRARARPAAWSPSLN